MANEPTVARPPVSSRCADWTLSVEHFGKIETASITMAPLVLLVGKNNTGKSYAATLLWSLLNSQQTIFSPRVSLINSPDWFRALFSNPASDVDFILSSSQFDDIKSAINETLERNALPIVQDLFSYQAMMAPNLRIDFPIEKPIYFKISGVPDGNSPATDDIIEISAGYEGIEPPFMRTMLNVDGEDDLSDFAEVLFGFLVDGLLSHGMARPSLRSSVLYIPAARTGLMLAYRFLVSQLIGTLGLEPQPAAKGALPLPTIRFLQALTEKRPAGNSPNPILGSIANWIEAEVLSGNVSASTSQIPDFTYKPANSADLLPLHVTSSMITELAPFLLALKAGHGSRGIVFEEPEAHLHLSAQRTIARALAQLVNAGIPVVVTTHSDTFVQQINNLIQLYSHSDKSELMTEFGYTESDLISPSTARGYEFVDRNGRTIVEELSLKAEGFVVPSLNDTLSALARETFDLQKQSGQTE